MKLEGSCHCGAVRFTLESHEPYPFNHCYCKICRKTAGAGGSAINLGGDFRTLKVEGQENITVYRAKMQNPEDEVPRLSSNERSFCRNCGSPLWCWHPKWPDLVHPHASAIDTDLPTPPQRWHMMLDFKASWVDPQVGQNDSEFARYPSTSLAEWHKSHGLDE